MFFDPREPDEFYDDLDPDLDDIPDLEYLDEELFKALHRDRKSGKEKAIERENQRWKTKKRRRERQDKYDSGWDD